MAQKNVKKAAKSKGRAAAAPKAAAKVKAADKVRTKSEVFAMIAEQTGVPRRQVAEVFDVMRNMIEKDLGKDGPGAFNVPGMMKVTVKRKPATKARKGINPFTKEEVTFKAKPARNVIKIRPLKALKDAV